MKMKGHRQLWQVGLQAVYRDYKSAPLCIDGAIVRGTVVETRRYVVSANGPLEARSLAASAGRSAAETPPMNIAYFNTQPYDPKADHSQYELRFI